MDNPILQSCDSSKKIDIEDDTEKITNFRISPRNPEKITNNPILQSCCDSSIEDDTEKIRLFICLKVDDDDDDVASVVWYQIDTVTGGSPKEVCRFAVDEISWNFGTAVLGSKIYMLGGDYKGRWDGTSDVVFFDTRADGDVFQAERSTSNMLLNRSCPSAVATHGKIYVFGSNMGGELRVKPWGEVFDPISNCWSPLPEPPPQARQGGICTFASAVIGDQILLCYGDTLLSFDVKTNRWEMLTSTHPLLTQELCIRGVAFDDTILFMYGGGSVVAYDFVRKKTLKVKGLGIKTFSSMNPDDLVMGYVLRLAQNIFCVVWYDQASRTQVYVRCVRFGVATVSNSKGGIKVFQAQVLGRSAYQIPHAWGHFSACLHVRL